MYTRGSAEADGAAENRRERCSWRQLAPDNDEAAEGNVSQAGGATAAASELSASGATDTPAAAAATSGAGQDLPCVVATVVSAASTQASFRADDTVSDGATAADTAVVAVVIQGQPGVDTDIGPSDTTTDNGAETGRLAASRTDGNATCESQRDSLRDECVICFSPLDDEEQGAIERLDCGHTFHAACIGEWLEKDGRCPVCRHVVNEEVANRSGSAQQPQPPVSLVFNGEVIWPPPNFVVGTEETTQLMLAESRRLMLFASMEAAMSMLTLSHTAGFVSPCLMLLAAASIFNAAANFSPRHVAIARPVLSVNVVYHLYLVAGPLQGALHQTAGASTHGYLVAMSCVTILELMLLKRAGFFHMALVSCSQDELERLRGLRQRNTLAMQRFQVLIVFLIFMFPLFGRSICMAGWQMDFGDFCPGQEKMYDDKHYNYHNMIADEVHRGAIP